MKKNIIIILLFILAPSGLILGVINYANAQNLAPLPPIPAIEKIQDTGVTATSRCLLKSPAECCKPTIDFDRPSCKVALAGQTIPKGRTYSNPIIQSGYDRMINCFTTIKDPSQCNYGQMDEEIIWGGWLSCRRACGDTVKGHDVSGENIVCDNICDEKWPDSLHEDLKKAAQDATIDWQAAQTAIIQKPKTVEAAPQKIIEPEKTSAPKKVTPETKKIEVPSPIRPAQEKLSVGSEPPRFKLIESFYGLINPITNFFRKIFRFGN